jgi:mitochondrial import receptor subunit TOM40
VHTCVRQGKREDRSCPPRLEELKKEAQGILSPDIFDGARFEFNKTLTQKFQLNHNITLGSSQVPSSHI